jgi:hypothetical protein
MRGADVEPSVIEEIAAAPASHSTDSKGNPILTGYDDSGRLFEVVVALDDPEFVITVIPRRERR